MKAYGQDMEPGSVPCVVHFKKSNLEVEVAAGRVLLEVAEEHGLKLPALCRGGTCGTCRIRLLAGSPAVQTTKALNVRQRAQGLILSCSARTVAGQRIVLDA